jgi:hypothetical protein
MREPRASCISNFDAKSSDSSNYRGEVVNATSIKSGIWLAQTPNSPIKTFAFILRLNRFCIYRVDSNGRRD